MSKALRITGSWSFQATWIRKAMVASGMLFGTSRASCHTGKPRANSFMDSCALAFTSSGHTQAHSLLTATSCSPTFCSSAFFSGILPGFFSSFLTAVSSREVFRWAAAAPSTTPALLGSSVSAAAGTDAKPAPSGCGATARCSIASGFDVCSMVSSSPLKRCLPGRSPTRHCCMDSPHAWSWARVEVARSTATRSAPTRGSISEEQNQE
mmetsp:Transcript_69527/g.197021  ORF Transcript_69527/g.197021 Transcript_69527/m.197021 type:complete len:209 (+) Transcript_69527:1096-1722(+)